VVVAYSLSALHDPAAAAAAPTVVPQTKNAVYVLAGDETTEAGPDAVVGLPDHVAAMHAPAPEGGPGGVWRESQRWAVRQSHVAFARGRLALVGQGRRLLRSASESDHGALAAAALGAGVPTDARLVTVVAWPHALVAVFDTFGLRLTAAGERAPGTTPVFWTEPATAACAYDDYLVVAAGHCLEVRPIDRLWELAQLVLCPSTPGLYAGGIVVAAPGPDAPVAAGQALYHLQPRTQ
jgi:hypothetical protein